MMPTAKMKGVMRIWIGFPFSSTSGGDNVKNIGNDSGDVQDNNKDNNNDRENEDVEENSNDMEANNKDAEENSKAKQVKDVEHISADAAFTVQIDCRCLFTKIVAERQNHCQHGHAKEVAIDKNRIRAYWDFGNGNVEGHQVGGSVVQEAEV